MNKLILSVFLLVCMTGVMNKSFSQQPLTYLALGDSYTIGESVPQQSSWPYLLQQKLQEHLAIEVSKVVATTGWTTDELIEAIEKERSFLDSKKYDLVSLLIGVNNQYRGYSIDQYKKEFEKLLIDAIKFADNKPSNVFVVSIPDYGITPYAAENGKSEEIVAKELKEYNQIAYDLATQYKVSFYDIFPISLKARWDATTYLAEDSLHPSGIMYQEWVDYFAASVYGQLIN